jgi:hypothetical protein
MISMRRFRRLLIWAAVLMAGRPVGVMFAQVPPAGGVIDDCQYSNVVTAQAVWKPMRGSAPVALTDSGG